MIKLNCVTINSLGGTKTGITQVDADDVASGKLCMTINNGTSDGSKPLGQQLGTDNYLPIKGGTEIPEEDDEYQIL